MADSLRICHPPSAIPNPDVHERKELANARDAVKAVVDEWIRAANERDAEACARLRAPEYEVLLWNEKYLTREHELAMLATHSASDGTLEFQSIRHHRGGATAELLHRGSFNDHRVTVEFSQRDERWIATSARVQRIENNTGSRPAARWKRLLSPVRRALRAVSPALPRTQQFQDLAYIPYMPGQDYLLEKPAAAGQPAGELPVPPRELWLGYNYLAHGAQHVAKMFELLAATGFDLPDGGRVLDLGCGAGRMIRHLRSLAERCEIWGTDISAAHIAWCRQHLSPPFHFATTTKVPHLPYKDESFDLIYCGSVFTHIDDLAEAWLLELHRIVKPGGRLYVTIHDKHSIELLTAGAYRFSSAIFDRHPNFERFRGEDFGMFALGRDNLSQVFYDGGFFRHMAEATFEVLSVTEEAYFYQTGYVLTPKR